MMSAIVLLKYESEKYKYELWNFSITIIHRLVSHLARVITFPSSPMLPNLVWNHNLTYWLQVMPSHVMIVIFQLLYITCPVTDSRANSSKFAIGRNAEPFVGSNAELKNVGVFTLKHSRLAQHRLLPYFYELWSFWIPNPKFLYFCILFCEQKALHKTFKRCSNISGHHMTSDSAQVNNQWVTSVNAQRNSNEEPYQWIRDVRLYHQVFLYISKYTYFIFVYCIFCINVYIP